MHVPCLPYIGREECGCGEEKGPSSPLTPLLALDNTNGDRPDPLSMLRSPLTASHGTGSSKPRFRARRFAAAVPITPSRYAAYMGSEYELEGVIGKGAFGLVTLVRPTAAEAMSPLLAMKTIDRFRLTTPSLRKAIAREIRLLRFLPPHEGIVPLVEVVETCRSIHMIFEYASGGTLQDYCSERGALGEACTQALTRQLCAAVAHLHAHRVCHRDLKLPNCVLDGVRDEAALEGLETRAELERGDGETPSDPRTKADGELRVRIIDFGLSVVIPEAQTPGEEDKHEAPAGQQLRKVAGSLAYMAPEMVARQPYYGERVDAWSLGVCIAAMLRGALPFMAETDEALRSTILSGEYSDLGEEVSEQARTFVASLLMRDPKQRCSVAAACGHEWLRES